MEIKELKAGQGKIDVEGIVKSKTDPRTFQKYGRELRVANAVLADESGEISLSLWNSDIDTVNVGDRVKITNGYVSEFNGKKQLSAGKFGKMEVISSGNALASAKTDEVEIEPKQENQAIDSETSQDESSSALTKSRGRKAKKVLEKEEFEEKEF